MPSSWSEGCTSMASCDLRVELRAHALDLLHADARQQVDEHGRGSAAHRPAPCPLRDARPRREPSPGCPAPAAGRPADRPAPGRGPRSARARPACGSCRTRPAAAAASRPGRRALRQSASRSAVRCVALGDRRIALGHRAWSSAARPPRTRRSGRVSGARRLRRAIRRGADAPVPGAAARSPAWVMALCCSSELIGMCLLLCRQ